MSKFSFALTTALLVFVSIHAHAAGNIPDVGATCVSCHGSNGISVSPVWPNLAGQKIDYITKQLTDFKEGRRNDPLMSPMAKLLSDQDVKVLAQYYSSIKEASGN